MLIASSPCVPVSIDAQFHSMGQLSGLGQGPSGGPHCLIVASLQGAGAKRHSPSKVIGKKFL